MVTMWGTSCFPFHLTAAMVRQYTRVEIVHFNSWEGSHLDVRPSFATRLERLASLRIDSWVWRYIFTSLVLMIVVFSKSDD